MIEPVDIEKKRIINLTKEMQRRGSSQDVLIDTLFFLLSDKNG